MAITRPLVALAVGQSYGAIGYNERAAYTMFTRAIQSVFASSAAAILSESGLTVTALSALQLYNKAVTGSAILQANAGTSGYWVSDAMADGPLLTAALTSIAGYATKPHVILHSHGEQDSTGLVSDTAADNMQTALTTVLWPHLRSAINSGSPTSIPIFMDMLGPRYPIDEQKEYKVRDRIIDAVTAATNVFWGVEKYALQLAGDVHPADTGLGYAQMGAWIGRIVASWLVSHSAVLTGPSISGVTRVGNRVTVAVNVPAGKTLIKPAAPDFLGLFDASENRLPTSNYAWSGNDLSFDVPATPAKFRYPARTGKLLVDTSKIIRLADPSDPLFTGEIGLPLRSCKTTAL